MEMIMSNKLQGKVAVITGGNSGIGLATAQALVDDGAKVVIVGRNRQTLDQASAALGPQASAIQADVASTDDLERAFETIRSTHGRIDTLLVNAGVAAFAPIEAVDHGHFDQLFDINVKGAYFTVQKALPHLNEGASIVFTSSVVNELGMPGATVYSATKAALRSFTRSLAAELGPRGIRVNAVAPGLTETPLVGKLGLEDEAIEAFANNVVSNTPLGRFGQPNEIAAVAAFLASPDSAFVNGAEFAVDGGLAQT
jgi:NAD(P)-dependent dehydrogenase (short-subunit alcohol dehydrogenase family)